MAAKRKSDGSRFVGGPDDVRITPPKRAGKRAAKKAPKRQK